MNDFCVGLDFIVIIFCGMNCRRQTIPKVVTITAGGHRYTDDVLVSKGQCLVRARLISCGGHNYHKLGA